MLASAAYPITHYGPALLRELPALGHNHPVSEVRFVSDGVLSESWLRDEFPGLSLHHNPKTLAARLTAFGQIAHARVSLELPGTLAVQVSERQPLLRVRLGDDSAAPGPWLVARDGTVYPGYNYTSEALASLPYLSGVRLLRRGEHFEPLAEAPLVEALLAALAQHGLARDIVIIDLARYREARGGPDATLSLITAEGHEYLFAPLRFPQQAARLSRLLASLDSSHQRGLTQVNLAFADQAVLRFEPASAPRPSKFRRPHLD